ncbi:MAG: phosphate acyltransferase [Candidatus Omnitrophica bacterium]|nr:phosphate acyltransferase [Candidatus Omnitrophota bacterium]
MDTIAKIRQMAKARQKTIALPEYEDSRTREAARIIEQEGIAKVVLLSPDKVAPQDKERFIETYYRMHQAKGVTPEAARAIFEDTLYCAAMMTREGAFDGFVAGAVHTTPDVGRASIRCLGVEERIGIACSCFIMVVPDCVYGESGTFVFADCGIIPDPSFRQLAAISVSAAELAAKVLGLVPRVALLSYSTRGSAKGEGVDKVTEALKLARQMAPDILIDGELQVDAAIVPEIAKIKYPDSPLGGNANVLIFPDLEAGNISYKLTQRLGRARALGPLLMGLTKPCSDLSRGCSTEDIVDCVAVTAIRSS